MFLVTTCGKAVSQKLRPLNGKRPIGGKGNEASASMRQAVRTCMIPFTAGGKEKLRSVAMNVADMMYELTKLIYDNSHNTC